MASWSENLRAAAASTSTFHQTETISQTSVIEVLNMDVTMEAAAATLTFAEQRKLDFRAREAMLAEVERVIKLIRDLRHFCEYYTALNQTQTSQCEQTRSSLEMINELVTSILASIPKQYVPSTDEQTRSEDKLDSLVRLEAAISRMLDGMSETEGQLRDAKQQVAEVTKELARMREMADKMQQMTDDVASRLRDVVNEKGVQMPLLGLICAAQTLLEDERKAKFEADQALLPEKKKVDEYLDRRRQLLLILRQLFERCTDVDQRMQDLGWKSPVECPKEANEKKMAGEFGRALSWLIERATRMITELSAAKQRLAETQETLERSRQISEDGAIQMKTFEDAIGKLNDKLADLNRKLADAAERRTSVEKEVEGMQAMFESEMIKLEAFREEEKNRWRHLAREHDEKSKRMRQELIKLSEDVACLREQTTQLTIRVERALNEYVALKEKLEAGKSSLNQANCEKEANTEKLRAEVAAIETKTKRVEREGNEYADEVTNSKMELDRRHGWLDGAKTRFECAKEQRQKEERELAALKDEADRLQEQIDSNGRNNRKMQENWDGLCQKLRQVEKENRELRRTMNERFPEKERAPCPTCSATKEVADQLPVLRREREQLEKEKADLTDHEDKLRQELERKKDKDAAGMAEKAWAKEPAVASFEKQPVSFPSKEQGTSIPVHLKPAASRKQRVEFKETKVKEWLVEEKTSVKPEAGPSKPSAEKQREGQPSEESVPEFLVEEVAVAKPKRKATKLEQVAVSDNAEAKEDVRRVSSGVRRSKRSAMQRLEGKQLVRSGHKASSLVATRTKSGSTAEAETEGEKRKISMQINVNVVDEESGSDCSSRTAAEEGYDVNDEEGSTS